jgi:WD40 repeat protein
LLQTLPALGGFNSLFFTSTGIFTATVAEDGFIDTHKIDPGIFQEPDNGGSWALNNKNQSGGFIAPGGKVYASQFRDDKGFAVQLWQLKNDMADRIVIGVASGYSVEKWVFALSPDEKHLVSIVSSAWLLPDCVMYQLNKWRCKPQKYTSPKGYVYQTTDTAQAVALQDLDNRVEGFKQPQFSPDNQYVAAISVSNMMGSSSGEQVRIWNVADGKLFQHIAFPDNPNGFLDIAFSPDSRQLAIMNNGGTNIKLWQFHTNEIVQTINGDFSAIQFSPDGSLLASGSKDGSIQLWRASDGTLLATLKGHAKPVTSLGFSPHGYLLASVSQDGTGMLWKIGEGK